MDQRAFSVVAHKHADSLQSRALNFTKDQDEAKDLVQDTLVKGIRFCHKFEEGSNLKAWLFVIMRNTFLNNYHRNKKRSGIVTTEEELSSVQLVKSASNNSAVAKFVMNDIQKALGSINHTYSIAFQRYFEGYKYQEIAEELNVPLGTVKTYIFQARVELKNYLKTYRDISAL